VEHHSVLSEVGFFVAELEKQDRLGVPAFRPTILTAARIGEVVGTRWSEIDMTGEVRRVPNDNAGDAALGA
jgi:integrase